MAQVNADNVLAVYRVLQQQSETMLTALGHAAWMNDIPRCANDPVSEDAKRLFQPKVMAIIATHTAHCNEIREAATRLHEAARQYGFTEDQIETSLRSYATPAVGGAAPEGWKDVT